MTIPLKQVIQASEEANEVFTSFWDTKTGKTAYGEQRRETLLSSETMVGGWPVALFPPIFHRRGMLFLPALRYAQRIFNTGGVPNEPDSHRRLYRA